MLKLIEAIRLVTYKIEVLHKKELFLYSISLSQKVQNEIGSDN
jgi:hypothetical protein